MNAKLSQAISFIVVFLIMSSLAIVHDGSLFGHSFHLSDVENNEASISFDDQTIINTSSLTPNVVGFNGPTPVKIYINNDNTVDSVVPLPNTETPNFFAKLHKANLFNAWNGKSVEEASNLQVDAVSGATFSSKAIIQNVQAGLNEHLHQQATSKSFNFSWHLLCAFIIALSAAIIPLFVKNKIYRFIQQLLNVGVLGFWTGTFLCYAMIIRVFANGIIFDLAGVISLLLLTIGFIFPLFGKHNHYCNNVCPLGSAQELMGHLSKSKLHLSANLVKILNSLRLILWAVLTLLLWVGIGTEWIDNELFSAFIVESASLTMLIIGGAILLISIFIPRPFCRFVCPTGSLLKQSEHLG